MATAGVPLTPEHLLQALQAAVSNDRNIVQLASKQLQVWETIPGYWSLLQDAYLDRTLQREVRWMSIITLKYGVERFWRKTATNSLSKEEKTKIRSRLLDSVDEPDDQLALQNAVIVGKVARNEYPLDWPDIFSRLLEIIRASAPPPDILQIETGKHPSTLRLRRSLRILLHVVKELCAGRLPRIRSNLQTASPELFHVVAEIYVQYVEHWVVGVVETDDFSDEWVNQRLTISLSCLKVLRRLLVSGFEFANRNSEIRQFWTIVNERWNTFIQLTSAEMPDENRLMITKHSIGLGKLYLDLSRGQPAAFALMPEVIVVLQNYWQATNDYGNALASGSKQGLGRHPRQKSEAGVSQDSEDRATFMEKIALQGMLLYRSCIQMVFRPTQTFKYRHKAEKEEITRATIFMKNQVLTLELATRYMELLVTKYFVLRKDDLEAWEEDPETWAMTWDDQAESWEYMIRPCAEKLFVDFAVNFKHDLALPIVNVFNNVAKVDNQDVLLKDSVYTAVGLVPAILEPHLDFNVFLENVLANEVQIAPYAHRVIAILPPLWEQTGEEHLFKQSILSVLTKIVSAMKDESVKYQDMVVNLIRYSVAPENGLQLYLLDDALELWDAVVQNTPANVSAPLLELVPLLLPCLELDTMITRKVLEVLEGYILLAPQEMLSRYAVTIFNIFGGLLGKGLKVDAAEVITDAMELIIRTAAAVQGEDGMTALGQAMVSSGVAHKLFEGIYQTWEAHQTSGPNKKYPELDVLVLTHYFQVLSRIILASMNVFVGLLTFVESEGGGEGAGKAKVTDWLMEEWFLHFGNIGNPRPRKLNCLALTKLLERDEEWILVRMQDLMNIWTDVVGEIVEEAKDNLVYNLEEDGVDPQSAESVRRKELVATDPVHTINIVEWIKHYLLQAQNRHGVEVFKAKCINNVDKDVLADFMKLNIFT
ncbi:Importin-11 [Orbilia brochopaga]|nr:Importin-11 [Drechslerella brochopaga]